MKKKILTGVAALIVLIVVLVVLAEKPKPTECAERNTMICNFCGQKSAACKKMNDSNSTAEECVQMMELFKNSEEMTKFGGAEAKRAFCDGIAD